jgi:hypothetical protein
MEYLAIGLVGVMAVALFLICAAFCRGRLRLKSLAAEEKVTFTLMRKPKPSCDDEKKDTPNPNDSKMP